MAYLRMDSILQKNFSYTHMTRIEGRTVRGMIEQLMRIDSKKAGEYFMHGDEIQIPEYMAVFVNGKRRPSLDEELDNNSEVFMFLTLAGG